MTDNTIVVIGATGKLGQSVCQKLHEAGLSFRVTGRSEQKLIDLYQHKFPYHIPFHLADNGDINALRTAMDGANTIINCSHSRFTEMVLAAAPNDAHFITIGSTRRYTKFPDTYAKHVERSHALLKSSGKSWIQLDPTMIYGPYGEENVQTIASYIKKFRIIPITQGGNSLIQPVFADDLARCICYLAQHREINGRAITIAGPKTISYKTFVQLIAKTIGHPVTFLNLPIWILLGLARMTPYMPGIPSIKPSQIQRQLEDKNFDISDMQNILPIKQVSLEEGLALTFNA